MTPEERSLLERTAKLTEENNTILLKLRRSGRVASVLHVFYWVIIIALSIGSYFAIQPLVKFLPSVVGSAQGDTNVATSALQQMKSLIQK